MANYTKTFELSVDDMELIEAALRDTKQSLSTELIDQAEDPLRPCDETRGIDADMKRITDLLGRLHNQKTFYRPSRGSYVSG